MYKSFLLFNLVRINYLKLFFIVINLNLSLIGAPCMNDIAGFANPVCTANDVTTATLAVFSGPSLCVNQTPIYVQLQAQSIAGSNARFDIGYFISLDGGDAKTGNCYIDYLPPPLSSTPTPSLTVRTSPYWTSDLDSCGDIEQNVTNYRNIGGTTVTSGTQGPPALLAIPCQDLNADNFSDITVCTTWDNQQNIDCASNLDTAPGTASKCRCELLRIGNISYKALCESDNDCNDNSACTQDSCNINTGLCENISLGFGAPCNDGNSCTENDSCGGINNLTCSGTPVICGDDPCETIGVCNFATGCPAIPDGTACDDGFMCTSADSCSNGTCVGTNNCPSGQVCLVDVCVECSDASQCDDGNDCTDNTCVNNTCVYPNNMSSCDDADFCTQNDICSNGSCAGSFIVCNTPGTCEIGTGTCSDGVCSYAAAPDGTSCGSNLQCQGGVCVVVVSCITDSDCNDGNSCTTDACSGGICSNTTILCTTPGICQTSPGSCSNGVCTYPIASDGTSCGINPNLTCISGQCWSNCSCGP